MRITSSIIEIILLNIFLRNIMLAIKIIVVNTMSIVFGKEEGLLTRVIPRRIILELNNIVNKSA